MIRKVFRFIGIIIILSIMQLVIVGVASSHEIPGDYRANWMVWGWLFGKMIDEWLLDWWKV